MSLPLLSLTNRWMSTFCFALCSVSMIASATLLVVREDHADALRALEELDDDRRAADALDRRGGRPRSRTNVGLRDADVVPAQDLQAPQLVPAS
jgi:hypothetical protein